MKINRKIMIVLGCGLLALALGLGSALGAEKTLRIGSPWGAKTLDPQKDGFLWMRLGVLEGLTDVDQELRLRPALAESWSVSADHKVWTFKIRPNVRFHDGTALTAGVMRDCLKRLRDQGALLKNVPLESIDAPDDLTLTIATTTPFAPLPAYLSKGEAAALAPSSFNQAGEVVKPVGTGFFKLESWRVKEEIVASANRDHWSGTAPRVDRVVCRFVPEAMTRSALVRTGELDIAQILPPDLAKSMVADPSFKLQSLPIARCRIIDFNLAREPFSDIRARRAVNRAINRQDLIEFVLDGFGEPAKSLFPSVIFWSNSQAPAYEYDPEKAKGLLAEAGWKDENGDGVREKDGRPLVVKFITYSNRAELPPLAEVIQNQLSQVGVKAELVVLQVDAANEMRNKGDFDLSLVGRGLLFTPDPDEIFMTDYFSENTFKDGWGAYHYRNEEVDRLILAGRAEFDAGKRKEIYDRVQELLLEDSPTTNLNYYVNVDVLNTKVKGYQMHPNEHSFRLESVELD
ncbi:MAG: ABC transporter substrate-binding protein [Pseudomonadota bacterium]